MLAMTDSQQYPLKLRLIKHKLDNLKTDKFQIEVSQFRISCCQL